ncbi:MAG: hypothetical protein ACRDRT_18450 [Pseudonocardiaceae bacterium]
MKPFFLASTNITYCVPDTCIVDVANAMRLHHQANAAFDHKAMRDAMNSFLDLVETNVVGTTDLVVESLEFCQVSTQLSTYVVLATELAYPLCTLDPQQAEEARGHDLEVLLPGTDYAAEWVRGCRRRFRK